MHQISVYICGYILTHKSLSSDPTECLLHLNPVNSCMLATVWILSSREHRGEESDKRWNSFSASTWAISTMNHLIIGVLYQILWPVHVRSPSPDFHFSSLSYVTNISTSSSFTNQMQDSWLNTCFCFCFISTSRDIKACDRKLTNQGRWRDQLGSTSHMLQYVHNAVRDSRP